MKKYIFGILFFLVSLQARATTVTGTINYPNSGGLTGKLYLALSQQGSQLSSGGCGGPAVIVPGAPVVITITAGTVTSSTIVGNDCIAPANTYYIAQVRDGNNNLLFQQNWQITGASINVGSILPIIVPQGTVSIGQAFITNLNLSGTCTGCTTTPTAGANTVYAGPTTGGPASALFRSLVGADLPVPGASSLGGVDAIDCTGTGHILKIPITGLPACSADAVAATGTTVTVPNSASNSCVNGETVLMVSGQAQLMTSAVANAFGHSIGVAVSGCATTGSAVIQTTGLVNALFSGGTTAGDYVGTSDFTNGALADSGFSGNSGFGFPPFGSGAVMGVVMTTNSGAGTYQVFLYGINASDTTVFSESSSVNVGNPTIGTHFASVDTSGAWEETTTTDAINGSAFGLSYGGGSWTGLLGLQFCTFDGAMTAGHWVIVSQTVAGDCHDSGSNIYPTYGIVVGRATSTSGSGGSFNLFELPVQQAGPRALLSLDSGSKSAAISSPVTIFTAPATGMYAIDIYVTITSATTGAVQVQVTWTDENSNNQTVDFSSATLSSNGSVFARYAIYVKTGTNVTYETAIAGTITYIVHMRPQAEI